MKESNNFLYEVKDPDPSWRDYAKCKKEDVNLFMSFNKQDISRAKAICIGCPVLKSCLNYAVANDVTDGVWGGTTPQERRDIKRARILLSSIPRNQSL